MSAIEYDGLYVNPNIMMDTLTGSLGLLKIQPPATKNETNAIGASTKTQYDEMSDSTSVYVWIGIIGLE